MSTLAALGSVLSADEPDARSAAVALSLAFVLAGVAHVLWMGSPLSRRLAIPIDGGRCWRGRRLLGDNKTWRGFVVLPPAAAVAMSLVCLSWSAWAGGLPRPWDLDATRAALLGALAGLGFMAGELPNSFLKRRCGIRPGHAAVGRAAPIFALLDRVDSIAGLLVAVACLVPLPWRSALALILIGPLVHFGFSAAQFALGGKARAA